MITEINFKDLHKFMYDEWSTMKGKPHDDFSLTKCIRDYIGGDVSITEIVQIRKMLFDLSIIYISVIDGVGYVVVKP